MIKLCLMASHGYPPGLVLNQEQGTSKITKDCQLHLSSQGARQERVPSSSPNLRPNHCAETWKPNSSLCESCQFVKIDSTIRRPALIDVQDTCPESVLFSFGIAEQYARQEKILKFLMSESSELERGGLDMSVLSNLMGLQPLTFDANQRPCTPSLIYPSGEFDSQKPLLDFVGDMVHSSKLMVHPNGQVSFTGSGAEMKDILSVVAEFYLSKNSTKWRKYSALVPQFSRLGSTEAEANVHVSSAKIEGVVVAPLKSPEKINRKPSLKKKNCKKGGRERDLYKKNYFHACESLLCLMLDKSQHRKSAILSLKKSGPELPELLMHFSAGIAGTGLAVLFSVISKVAFGRVPFSASKLLNAGFGFGLVWLSWAANELRDTIIYARKNEAKLSLKEDEMLRRVDKSVNDIYFRAITLLVVAVLRFA